MEAAGSYRRGRDTIGDLDIVVESTNAAEVMDRLGEFPGVETVLGRGDTKMSVRLGIGLQVDLRIVPAESFGAALVYFTGSKQHNIVLRGMAKDRGLRINEYGVFRLPKASAGKKAKEPEETDESKLEYIAGRTEKDVYATLDLPVFPPEIREARFEFDWAKAGPLPKLIELADIQGDLHMHTTESDGKASLEEMVDAAQSRGLKYIAITDHSKRVSMANGLDGSAASQAMGRNRRAQREARRLSRAQRSRGRYPRARRPGYRRRRARRGRLGGGQRALRPESAGRSNHQANRRCPGQSARLGHRPSDRPDHQPPQVVRRAISTRCSRRPTNTASCSS